MSLDQYTQILIETCIWVISIALIVHVYKVKAKEPELAKAMLGLLACNVLVNISESAVLYYQGVEAAATSAAVRVGAFITHLLIFVLIFFFTGFAARLVELRRKTYDKKLVKLVYAICLIGAVMLILSRILGFYYHFDGNVYYRDDTHYIHGGIVGTTMIVLLAGTLNNRKYLERKEFWMLILLCCIPFMLTGVQILSSGLTISNIIIFACIMDLFIIFRWETSDISLNHRNLRLTGINIDLISDATVEFMTNLGLDPKTKLRTRLKIEEILLRMKDQFGEDARVDFLGSVRFGRPTIRILLEGEPYNPLSRTDDELSNWSIGLLKSTDINPIYKYAAGKNDVRLSFPKRRMNPTLKMLVAVTVGVLFGVIAMRTLLSADQQYISEGLSHIYELLLNILYCASGPIIFFMIVTTVLNTGAISDQGGRSVVMLLRYFGLTLVMGVATLFITSMIFNKDIKYVGPEGDGMSALMGGLFDIVPSNPIAPFIDVKSHQIILMAIVIGGLLIAIGKPAGGVGDFMRQCNIMGMRLAEWIGRLIPYFAVVMVILAFMQGNYWTFVKTIKVVVISITISFLCTLISMLVVSLRKKVDLSMLTRKLWPSFKVAIKTGSADSSYNSSEQCCINELGIQQHFAEKSLPLGTVMYMPANVIGTLCFMFFAAYEDHMDITLRWVIIALVLSIVLIVATPPIPGANFLAYLIVISQLGISEQFIVVALIFDIVYGTFATAANQAILQMEMTVQADKIGLLDHDTLRNPRHKS